MKKSTCPFFGTEVSKFNADQSRQNQKMVIEKTKKTLPVITISTQGGANEKFNNLPTQEG